MICKCRNGANSPIQTFTSDPTPPRSQVLFSSSVRSLQRKEGSMAFPNWQQQEPVRGLLKWRFMFDLHKTSSALNDQACGLPLNQCFYDISYCWSLSALDFLSRAHLSSQLILFWRSLSQVFLVFGRSGWIGGLVGELLTSQGTKFEYANARLEDRAGILADIERVRPGKHKRQFCSLSRPCKSLLRLCRAFNASYKGLISCTVAVGRLRKQSCCVYKTPQNLLLLPPCGNLISSFGVICLYR